MTRIKQPCFSRRAILKTGGALVVSVGAPIAFDTVLGISAAHAQATAAKPPLTPDQLSSYIAVGADGKVSAFFGKMDMGQGLFVAIGQMVAEELDVPFKAVKVIMGDTATSVNQAARPAPASRTAASRCAAAAEAPVLVEMASQVRRKRTALSSMVSAPLQQRQASSYAGLIGVRYFQPTDWNKIRQPLTRPARPSEVLGAQDCRQRSRQDIALGVLPGGLRHRRQGTRYDARHDTPGGRRGVPERWTSSAISRAPGGRKKASSRRRGKEGRDQAAGGSR
jgi:hypothetical protein